MLEQRNLKLDLAALVLLALAVFLSLSLATYQPADPVTKLVFPFDLLHSGDIAVYPQSEQVGNACGRWGALAADMLLSLLGIGAYYAVISLAVLDMMLLMRKPIDAPIVRAGGWLASLAGLTALVAIVGFPVAVGPVIGPGGYLGALGRGIAQSYFATFGGAILALSLLFGGLLLCTDYVLLQISGAVLGRVTGGVSRAAKVVAARKQAGVAEELTVKNGKKKAAPAPTDLEDASLEIAEALDEPLTVKIGGKRGAVEEAPVSATEERADADEEADLEADQDAEADEQDTDSEEDSEEAEDEKPAKKSLLSAVKQKLTPRLRVTKGTERKSKDEPEKDERDEVIEQLQAASETAEASNYELPSIDMLIEAEDFQYDEQEKEVRQKAKVLEKTFKDFGFNVKVVEIETGPVIAQYEVELEAGLRLSRITGLADDLAIALRVPSVRIVAPIPGKNTVGIEVPNTQRQIVRLREVMEESSTRIKKMRIPLFLGKDVSGKPLVVDLATLPHLLIAGRTGTGKSVCLNAIITSMLMTRRPDEVRMLMIDPKMVELSCYKTLPHLMHPVVTDMRKAEAILAWAVEKMEERYALLAKAGVRHITSYNQLGEEELMERLEPESDEDRKAIPLQLPFIVIVADEMADLMMTSGKEVEQHIIRLAQKSRAVGIHLILATQKPTVDVITGLIKSNLPARIAFQVASRTDSRVVLDEMGADKLLGNGDMLFLWPGTSALLRGQGTYVTDEEINEVTEFVSQGGQQFVKELVQLKVGEDKEGDKSGGFNKNRDELYEDAVDIVVREGRGSVSLLQRALGIGYGRAARLIDYMAEDGIVGTYAGSQAREVAITVEQWEAMQRGDGGGGHVDTPAPATPAAKRTNKIVPVRDEHDEEEEAPPAKASKRKPALKQPAPSDELEEDEVEDAFDEEENQDEVEEYAEDEEASDEYEPEYEDEEASSDEETAEEEDELADKTDHPPQMGKGPSSDRFRAESA